MRLNIRGLDPGKGNGGKVLAVSADGREFELTTPSGGGASALADLTDVDLTGIADGDVLKWDSSAGMFLPAADDTGGGGSSTSVLLLDAGASVPGGTAVGTIIFQKAPTAVIQSFAGLSALPAGWTKRGSFTETYDSAGMTFTPAAGQGFQTTTGYESTDFTLELEMLTGSASSVMQGPIAATSGGGGAAAFGYSSPQGILAGSVSGWSYGGSFGSAALVPSYPSTLRLRRSGTSWYAAMKIGGSWSSEASLTNSFTPANVGFGSILGSASMKVSQFKLTPGAGSGSSGLRGWWDGSAIVPF